MILCTEALPLLGQKVRVMDAKGKKHLAKLLQQKSSPRKKPLYWNTQHMLGKNLPFVAIISWEPLGPFGGDAA